MENKTERTFAEVFPPGEFIKDELEARGWTQLDLAQIMGRDPVQVNLIVKGKQSLTAETAKQLGDAFGTGTAVLVEPRQCVPSIASGGYREPCCAASNAVRAVSCSRNGQAWMG